MVVLGWLGVGLARHHRRVRSTKSQGRPECRRSALAVPVAGGGVAFDPEEDFRFLCNFVILNVIETSWLLASSKKENHVAAETTQKQ